MNSEAFESTYALLMRSDEKERSVSETFIYVLLIATMIFTVWQVAQMRVTVPENLSARTAAQSTLVRSQGV